MEKIRWPDGKSFAFTIFDDADNHTDNNVNGVYAMLKELGFKTTKSVWPNKGTGTPICGGLTCEDHGYLDWIYSLREAGFEIGYHLATYHSSFREDTIKALEKFKNWFGADPKIMANHALCKDTIYWGASRLENPLNKLLYQILNVHKDKGFLGHDEKSPYFWGDLCKQKIKYVRNFTFREVNTLKICPIMPYADPAKKYVNLWYASTEGPVVEVFNKKVTREKIDALEAEGGLCIMYTHFGNGFSRNGKINPDFQRQMEYLAGKNCWFAPVSTVLDYLIEQNGIHTITAQERTVLERKWLKERFVLGST